MPPRAHRPLVEYKFDSDDSVAPFDTLFPPRHNFVVERHFSDDYDSIDEPIPSPPKSDAKAKSLPTKAKLTKTKQIKDIKSSDSRVELAPVHERSKAKARNSTVTSKHKQASGLTREKEEEVAPVKYKRVAAQQAEPLILVKRQRATVVQKEEVMVPAKRKRAAAAAPKGKPVSKKLKTPKTSTKLPSTPFPKARRGAANLPPKNPVTFTPSGPSPSEVPALMLH
ncbi:hypothetical protein MMC07_009098 [Pseudocyphellaria aurata]|nr:hypothetical protein [Pseudocyphellaria aurata]